MTQTHPHPLPVKMLGFAAANAVVSILLGYCVSDIISKCRVDIDIYHCNDKTTRLQ